MKTKTTFFMVIVMVLLAPEVFGQLSKGNFFLIASSNMSISSEKMSDYQGSVSTETGKNTGFYLYPGAGYLLLDNLVVGLNVGVSAYGTRHTGSDTRTSSFRLSAGPFARYYFLAQDQLKPMAQISFGVGSNKSKYTSTSSTYDTKGGLFEFAAGVGASYFITENVAFDCLLYYHNDHTKDKTNTDRGSKSSGILLDFGVIVTIAR